MPADGITFVGVASADEYPMQWREVTVRPCEVELRAHDIVLPALLAKSAARDSRAGRNEAKRGGALDRRVVLRTC